MKFITLFILMLSFNVLAESAAEKMDRVLLEKLKAATAEAIEAEPPVSLYGTEKFVAIQSSQGLVLSMLMLYKDIGITQGGFISNRKLKPNLKNFYNKISELASSCTKDKNDTKGLYTPQSEVVRNLKAIDLVNSEIHRKSMWRTEWSRDMQVFMFTRLKKGFSDPWRSSFNICLYKPLQKVYTDPALCENLSAVTQCLVAFQSSGKTPKSRLNNDEMLHLFTEDKGINDISNLMER